MRREGEVLERETEKAQEEAAWAQESAVALAESRAKDTRPEFVAKMYMPQEPYIFIPFGFDSYMPRQEHYDSELVLRDPEVHMARTWQQRRMASSRGHGGPASSLELYRELPERDTSNTFHFPIGEMTVTPLDFAAIIGLRVRGEPILFDSGIHRDAAALRWFLGKVPERGEEMVQYTLAELQRFTIPTDLSASPRRERDYAIYRREYLAGAFEVMAHQAMIGEAMEAGEERRGQSGRIACLRERSTYAATTGFARTFLDIGGARCARRGYQSGVRSC
ncbi:hypothetical protein RHMOL_Rhmol05G0143000 [Rhododendron molle]|uniref:Uncharacterized protein n=1 Tax=Rhododendron molle TaxID=49168 RepID=A0ACC0NP24_RHOML|nr:hypothetical protein RHMOL_Rhmol05G0143000 [Rhododendron molle]